MEEESSEEEVEVVFKLLCKVERVGRLIGKGGSIIRALQKGTGASIKISTEAVPPHSGDERLVLISAREKKNSERRHSPTQDAVIRVHARIAEIAHEPGAAVVARLLVHSHHMPHLFAKGGQGGALIIADLRRATGASIYVFPNQQSDELLQVIGSLKSVQDALFQITNRLRELFFPIKPHLSTVSTSTYLSQTPEMPPPKFRQRHDSVSPSYHRGADRVSTPSQHAEPHLAFTVSVDADCFRPPYLERPTYQYGSERLEKGSSIDRQFSPKRWTSQAGNFGNQGAIAARDAGFSLVNGPSRSEVQASVELATSVEIVIPWALLSHVYGENNNNLFQVREISGANVIVHNPRLGATEGMVVISGTLDQVHSAQCLIHGFILCEQNF